MKKIDFIRDHFIEILLSIPKTIYFNFRFLPFSKAVKFPFIVSYHIKTKGLNKRNFIVENQDLSFACSRIGFEYTVGAFNAPRRGLIESDGGVIRLIGNVGLSQGIVVYARNSTITLGRNFRCNYSTSIIGCDADITFGDEVVLGWNVVFKSDDGHGIIYNGERKKICSPITIGNHVWICSNSTILKGAQIGDGCVVAYGSVVTAPLEEDNILIGGVPARKIRDQIDWVE